MVLHPFYKLEQFHKILRENQFLEKTNQTVPKTNDSPPDSVNVCCHGKVILIGEHAVIYGAKALAMPMLGMSMNLHVRKSIKTKVIIDDKDLTIQLGPLFEDASEHLKLQKVGYEVQGRSTLPLGAGLGSSAALNVGIVRSLSKLWDLNLDDKTVAELANLLEKRFHGSPSGLDTSVVSFDKPIIFRRDESGHQIQRLNSSGQFKFAVIDSQKRASTKEMVTKASAFFQRDESGKKLLEEFESAADELQDGLNACLEHKVKSAMTKAYMLLDHIKVIPTGLKSLASDILETGCIAVKPTGAGGGGCLLALLPSSSEDVAANRILTTLRNKFGTKNVYEVSL